MARADNDGKESITHFSPPHITVHSHENFKSLYFAKIILIGTANSHISKVL